MLRKLIGTLAIVSHSFGLDQSRKGSVFPLDIAAFVNMNSVLKISAFFNVFVGPKISIIYPVYIGILGLDNYKESVESSILVSPVISGVWRFGIGMGSF